MSTPLPRVTLRDAVAWLLRRRTRYTVANHSMAPTLCDGETVLVRAYRDSGPAPGDIVLAQHPNRNMNIVKRVHHLEEGGGLFLTGDNAAQSTDSRHWGPLPPSALLGRVVAVVRP